MANTIKIRQIRSTNGCKDDQVEDRSRPRSSQDP